LRDQLVEELKAISSSDNAALWSPWILGAKNSLTEVDARRVEDAFQAKLATLEGTGNGSDQPSYPRGRPSADTAVADGIDKNRLAAFRDKEHVKFVATQPCLIRGRRPADTHLCVSRQHHALGCKVRALNGAFAIT
jgi:hypothetical protein